MSTRSSIIVEHAEAPCDAYGELSVTRLVELLDATGDEWSLYRLGYRDGRPVPDGDWSVSRGSGKQQRSVTATTIPDALRAALELRILPVVPRRPHPYWHHCTIVKRSDGGHRPWELKSENAKGTEVFMGGRSRTKRDAQARLDEGQQHEADVLRAWEDEYAVLVDTGTEGIDFYYEW